MLGQISEYNTVQKQFSTHVLNDSPHFPLYFVSPEARWPLKIISFYPKGHAIKIEYVCTQQTEFNPVTSFVQDKKWQASFPNMSLNIVQSNQWNNTKQHMDYGPCHSLSCKVQSRGGAKWKHHVAVST